MEATIEKLVDNLEYEKGLNKKEKEEIDDVLRTAAKGIEPDRIAEFVKAMRRKVDAPTSNIFTEEGVNVESLKSEAKIEAKIVIKLQVEAAQRVQQENKGQQGDIIVDSDKNKAKENEKANEEYKEKIINENKNYLDKYMPRLEESAKSVLAEAMYEAQEFVDEFTKRVKNGEDPNEVREDISKRNGETKADTDFRELATIINLENELSKDLNAQEHVSQENGSKSVVNSEDIVNALPENIQAGIRHMPNGDIDKMSVQSVKHEKAIETIESIRKEIAKIKNDIKENSEKADYPDNLIALYEKLEEQYQKLRVAIQVEEQCRSDRGEQDVIDKKSAERKQFIESAKQRYLTEGNQETIVEIFEGMKKEAEKQGIELEEIIGFEDILGSIKEELKNFPQLVLGDVDTIVKNERNNYKVNREIKSLDIVKNNVQKKIVQARLDKDPSNAKYYEDLAEKYSKRGHENSWKINKNREVNKKVKEKYNNLKGVILRRDEKLKKQKAKDLQSVDTQRMKTTEDRAEFIKNVTQLYFSSDKNVVDIYEQFKENCIRMGIKPEDIINAVSAETLKYDNSSNYVTIKQFEKDILEYSHSIEVLSKESKDASLNGNEDLENKNNKKIEEAQKKLESKKATNAAIKRAVLLNKSEQEKTEDLSGHKSTESKTNKDKKTTRKRGIFSFLKRKMKKLDITPDNVNEEVSVLTDLQMQEQREATNDQNAYQTRKNTTNLTVSTINVSGEEPIVESENPNIGDDGR